ncbi:hypothetical protein EPN16_07860 [bacterium]|nr:MAG: hypothetical protein EPN16_07860 [bacterium]
MPNPFLMKFSNVDTQLKFELPEQDTYILKIWNPRLPELLYLNGRQISPYHVSKKKESDVAYMIAPVDYVIKGINTLDVSAQGKFSIKIQNFFGAAKSNNMYVLPKSSNFVKKIRFDIVEFIAVALFICIILILSYSVLSKSGIEIFSLYLFSYIPYFLCLGLLFAASFFSPARLVMSASAFIAMSFILVGIVKIPLLATALLKKHKFHISPGTGDVSGLLIFLFMWLIFFTAISLLLGIDMLGEFLINIAYVILTIGVSIKMLKKIKKGIEAGRG